MSQDGSRVRHISGFYMYNESGFQEAAVFKTSSVFGRSLPLGMFFELRCMLLPHSTPFLNVAGRIPHL